MKQIKGVSLAEPIIQILQTGKMSHPVIWVLQEGNFKAVCLGSVDVQDLERGWD